MSIDRRLRETFHRAADVVTPDVWDGLSSVLARRRRRRQVQLFACAAAAIFIAVAAFAGPDVWDAISIRPHPPAEAPPAETSPRSLLGIYVVDDPAGSPVYFKGELLGRWTMHLTQHGGGNVRLTADPSPSASGPNAPRIIPAFAGSYEVAGARFTTDVLSETSWCRGDPDGTYQWQRSGSSLRFTVLEDPCAVRRALLAGPAWRAVDIESRIPERLVGSYRATVEAGRGSTRRGVAGVWILHFRPSGRIVFEPNARIGPSDFRRPFDIAYRGTAPTHIEIVRGFDGHCSGVATYAWGLRGDQLTLELVDDECVLRRIVLASQPWARI